MSSVRLPWRDRASLVVALGTGGDQRVRVVAAAVAVGSSGFMVSGADAGLDPDETDLGYGHGARFYGWHPNRELNPQYAGVPDVDRAGLTVSHPDRRDSTRRCRSAVMFEGTSLAATLTESAARRSTWHVDSWEPLILSPSLLCGLCGDHGWVREGRWVPA